MTPTECRDQRNAYLARSREEAKRGSNLAVWFDIFAKNFDLMMSDDPMDRRRGAAMLKQNSDRFERDVVGTDAHS